MKVIVGMSGGVDSSVAAYLLREQGYEVEGVSFRLYEARLKKVFSGCCSIESINDARRTAEHIGISHSSMDLRDDFMEKVIEPFISAYSNGITPNPCILCNRHIKFPFLIRIADERGADFIATGHYAVVERINGKDSGDSEQDEKEVLLKKGIDPKKDQSYVLYVLRRNELDRLLLPLGGYRKEGVRQIAQTLGLPAAMRPESQEICFVEDGNYCGFLSSLAGPSGGPVIDVETGKTIGEHRGIHLFTIGQRKRLGVATGRPLYVARINPKDNTVYVGPREAAMMREFLVEDINWLSSEIDAWTRRGGEVERLSLRTTVKVRSMMPDEPATATILEDGRAIVLFDEPQWAPAPGQSAVFYNNDIVVGGGVICGQQSEG